MAPPVAQLASDMLKNPVRVSVTPEATTAETVSHGVYFVEKAEKRGILESILREGTESVIVFTRTKHGANRLAEQLGKSGFTAAAIHGNKSQGARERALGGFREGTLRVLVATDLAARGIDVEGLSLVVNYELPNVPESYVHRIGRTGRAGASGRAISLCDFEERAYLRDIERLLRQKVPVLGGVDPAPAAAASGRAPAVHAHGRAPVTAPPPRNAPPPRHPAPAGRPMSSPRTGASPRPAHPNANPHARRGPSGR
jgi:ATP-dependent RNA helicase RhlE